MVEPITMIIIAVNIISFIRTCADFYQHFFGSKATLSPTSERTSSVTYPSLLTGTTKVQSTTSKPKKKSSEDDQRSSSNISLILIIIAIIFAVVAFLLYRKRTEIQKDRFRFRQTEEQLETPPSPSTEFNRSSVVAPIRRSILAIV